MTARWACVIGHPIAHSLSPAMHNAAFAALRLDASYHALNVHPDDLAPVLASFRAPDCLGANVTAPHKRAVMPLLDDLTPEARLVGAVNTIISANTRLAGDNTDAQGLAAWLRAAAVDVAGQTALVLGAGGAARAAVLALARLGAAAIVVANRTPERAEALVADLRPHLGRVTLSIWPLAAVAAPPAGRGAAAVVNATSLGHEGGAPALHPAWLDGPAPVAVDLAYNPPVTPFMDQITQTRPGTRVENGLGMLVYQAVAAFECWTGQRPEPAILEQAALAALAAPGVASRAPESA